MMDRPVVVCERIADVFRIPSPRGLILVDSGSEEHTIEDDSQPHSPERFPGVIQHV